MNKRYLLSTFTLAACTLLIPSFGNAQDFPPKRPVTLYVGFAPGGAAGDLDSYWQHWMIHQTDSATGRLNKIKNIVALNTIAQAHDVRVINIDSFWPVPDYEWPSNVYWPISINFWDWANDKGYARTPWGHFARDAHSAFAEYILKNIAG